MLAQSAAPPIPRQIECKITNCHYYQNELGQDKISFDVYAHNLGSEFIEMGNSSLIFSFRPESMGDLEVKFNENQMAGYHVATKIIHNRIIFVQYYADGGGWVLDSTRQGEWLFSITLSLKYLNDLYLIWNERDSAIMDRNLLFPVKNSFSGKFEFPTK